MTDIYPSIEWEVIFEPSNHPTPNGRYGYYILKIKAAWYVKH